MAFWTGRLTAARTWLVAFSGILILAACADADLAGEAGPDPKYSNAKKRRDPVYTQSLFGEGGLSLGGKSASDAEEGASGLGVNSFLWRASLDTLSFMPLASADPFGGVIITDWYSAPDAPDERFKVTVYILGRQLRSDAVRAQVFRQARGSAAATILARARQPAGQRQPARPAPVRGGPADWVDVPVDQATPGELENAILTRARQLRIASGGGQ